MDRWIDSLDILLGETNGSIPSLIEAQVIGSLTALVFRRPDHPMAKVLAERSFMLARSLPTIQERLVVCHFAGSYGIWVGDYSALHVLLSELSHFVRPEDDWRWATVGLLFGCVLWQQAEHDQAFAVLDRALTAAREHGFPLLESTIHLHIAYTAMSCGDVDRAERAIAAGIAVTHESRSTQVVHLRFMEAGVRLLRGQLKEAIAIATDTLPTAIALGPMWGEATFRIQFGQMLMLDGRHAEAREHFGQALAFGCRMPSAILSFQAFMALAWSQFDTGDHEAAMQSLCDALAIGAAQNYMNCDPWWIPRVMARLCERALAADIETAYVCRLIRKRGLTPESLDPAAWPWPIELRALGGFSIIRDGEAATFHGKSQQRVLDLLKAIVAFGGRAVSVDILRECLWPDAEGDAAKGVFDVTLHRLRKLLRNDAALVLSSGRIGVNSSVCHLDVLSFERAANAIETWAHDRRTALDALMLERATEELIRVYPGHLLMGESEYPWLLAPRERLSSRFTRTVRALGDRLMEAELREAAIRLYRHGIEMDPSDEELYRRLIRILIENGNTTEAFRLYARCQNCLAAAGTMPSRETESVIAALRRPS